MPRAEAEFRITPSVLDRLLDYEPGVSQEPVPSRSKGLRELKQSVRRDLEWLLNTRQMVDGVPPELQELTNSLAAYGLPDFTNVSIKGPESQNRLRRAVEVAIRVFEPRLENVVVTLESSSEHERGVRFRIDARLRVEPAPEPITFDTFLEPDRTEFKVKG